MNTHQLPTQVLVRLFLKLNMVWKVLAHNVIDNKRRKMTFPSMQKENNLFWRKTDGLRDNHLTQLPDFWYNVQQSQGLLPFAGKFANAGTFHGTS